MTVLRFAAPILLSLVATTAAHAAQPENAPVVPAMAVNAGDQTAAAPTVRVKRYCISDRREGAPRRPKICRTREDWQARGFDPLVALGRI